MKGFWQPTAACLQTSVRLSVLNDLDVILCMQAPGVPEACRGLDALLALNK